jgi:hypothetical protein
MFKGVALSGVRRELQGLGDSRGQSNQIQCIMFLFRILLTLTLFGIGTMNSHCTMNIC